MKERIWELDTLRGICVLGMVMVHFMYDLVHLYGLIRWDYPQWFELLQQWGGVLFLLISGICVTLGSRSVRRGLIVFGCGMVISAVTAGMYLLGFAGKGMIIYFGVLHCLGSCMLLWPLVKKAPIWLLLVLGIAMVAAGSYVKDIRVEGMWLVPLGFMPRGFVSSDYFPLFPNMGFFLLGAVMGKTVYRRKQSLMPGVKQTNWIVGSLSFVGRNSLQIYMLHQPVLALVCEILAMKR